MPPISIEYIVLDSHDKLAAWRKYRPTPGAKLGERVYVTEPETLPQPLRQSLKRNGK